MAPTRWDRPSRDLDLVQAFRDRHGRRARALASLLEGCDDDELVLRPWELRLPRVVVHAVARSRGFTPVGPGRGAAAPGAWLEPMRFAREADRR